MKNAIYIFGTLIAIFFNGYAFADWSTVISIKGPGIEGVTNGQVIIGEAEISDIKPSPPDAPVYSCKIAIPSSDWKSSNTVDIKESDDSNKSWILAINPKGNSKDNAESTVQVSWDPSTLGDGNFELRKGWKVDGEVMISDLKKVSSFEVSGENDLDQYFTIVQY